jgi:hypothetical protein
MKHRKRHIADVALPALHHFHVNAESGWVLSGLHGFTFLETTDEHLERRDHGSSVSCDDFAFGREFRLWHGALLHRLGWGAIQQLGNGNSITSDGQSNRRV